MNLSEVLYVDSRRLDSYFEQIALSPVAYDKVPTIEAAFKLTGPEAKATQTRPSRAFTQREKLNAILDWLERSNHLAKPVSEEERRDAKAPFRLESVTARRVILPMAKASPYGSSLTLWLADPRKVNLPLSKQTCSLLLLQDFVHADGDPRIYGSIFSTLEAFLIDLQDTEDGTKRYLKTEFFGTVPESQFFCRNAATFLQEHGAKVFRPRRIVSLYRERFTAYEDGQLEDEAEIDLPLPRAAHAMVLGYAVAIAAASDA